MAIRKISEFVSATPTSEDKILFEQNGKGKSCSIGDAVNICSLTLEEIQETADLTGKVASAKALKDIDIVPNHSPSSIINVTELTTAGGTWTAPSNGFLCVYGVKNNDDFTSEISMRINGIDGDDIRYKAVGSCVFYSTNYVPLKKGDKIVTSVYTNMYTPGGGIKFIPSV